VRFGQEIAGVMELGMAGRGEHSEIMTFVGRSVDSELSGNMIDLCPVGALTSKPFRYEARAWELSRRKSISPHDSLGSNLIVQVKSQRVLRVLPLENAAVNDCWLSDRDRFSYEGLHAADRLGKPMLKQEGQWREVEWPDALEYVRHALLHVKQQHGPEAIGALAAPSSTLEELHLLAKLVRGIGSDNIDHRLRQTDFSGDAAEQGVPWLGMPVQDIDALDRVLLVGSFLRKDHPLLSARLRHAVRRGCQLSVLHAADDDLLMRVAHKVTARPSAWARSLAGIAVAIAEQRGLPAPVAGLAPDESARAIAASLLSGERKAIFLGNAAVQHPAAATLRAWAQWIAQATGATLGVLVEGANSVGAQLVGARPRAGGLDARRMVEQARRAYLLWNFEPEYDTADPVATLAALRQADTVVAFSPYRNGALEYADAILPIAPFTETAGTFVNCEGRVQGFNGTVRPLGDARPGWKVLRVLGNLLELDGFGFETSEAVRDAALPADIAARLSNATTAALTLPADAVDGLERLADVPIYFTDAIVRRSPPLQATADAQPPRARVNARTAASLSLGGGDKVRVSQGNGSALLDLQIDDRLADGVVRVAAAHPSTAALGPMFGPVRLERA
jgi:NADH-quinone oxidoreductase subunit G